MPLNTSRLAVLAGRPGVTSDLVSNRLQGESLSATRANRDLARESVRVSNESVGLQNKELREQLEQEPALQAIRQRAVAGDKLAEYQLFSQKPEQWAKLKQMTVNMSAEQRKVTLQRNEGIANQLVNEMQKPGIQPQEQQQIKDILALVMTQSEFMKATQPDIQTQSNVGGQTVLVNKNPLAAGGAGVQGVLGPTTSARQQVEQGAPGDFANQLTKTQRQKELKERVDAQANTENIVRELGNLKDIINRPGRIGGATGDVVQFINSARAQIGQATGVLFDITKVEGLNADNMKIQQAAMTGAEEEALIMELAFLHAKALDPAGRISDKDVSAAQKMIGRNADPVIATKTIDNMITRVINNFNVRQSGARRLVRDAEDILPFIEVPEPTSIDIKSIDDMTPEEALQELLGNG